MQGFWDISNGAKILLAAASVLVLAEGGYLYYVQVQAAQRPQTCQYIIAQWEKAEPQAAAAKEKYNGAIAAVTFDERHPQAEQFQTAISEAAAKGANFAGHYAIAEWGCGTNCQDHAVVDVVTGDIVAMGIPSEAGLRYAVGSNLIMTNPSENMPSFKDLRGKSFEEQSRMFNIPREYYALHENDGRASVSRLCIESAYDNVF